MKYFITLFCALIVASCSNDSDVMPVKKQRIKPTSQTFIGKDSTFLSELSSPFQQLRYSGRDTLSTIYGNAIQDSYILDHDTLSMIISIAKYDEEVFNKRKTSKLFESGMNMFLYSLNAKKTAAQQCTKKYKSTILNGERTFFSFSADGRQYFGVSEMYARNARMHHICIISKDKEDFLNSDHIALAFNSYQPK